MYRISPIAVSSMSKQQMTMDPSYTRRKIHQQMTTMVTKNYRVRSVSKNTKDIIKWLRGVSGMWTSVATMTLRSPEIDGNKRARGYRRDYSSDVIFAALYFRTRAPPLLISCAMRLLSFVTQTIEQPPRPLPFLAYYFRGKVINRARQLFVTGFRYRRIVSTIKATA